MSNIDGGIGSLPRYCAVAVFSAITSRLLPPIIKKLHISTGKFLFQC
jgi:hypothetical protein